MPGYRVGPVLLKGTPWPSDWEQSDRLDDGHVHDWESVLLRSGGRVEEVIRCATCQAPRCGHSTDLDPCMSRRHHRFCHRLLSGLVEHMGGSTDTCRCQ